MPQQKIKSILKNIFINIIVVVANLLICFTTIHQKNFRFFICLAFHLSYNIAKEATQQFLAFSSCMGKHYDKIELDSDKRNIRIGT